MNEDIYYECLSCGKRISGQFFHQILNSYGHAPRCTCSPNYLDGMPKPGVWRLVSEISVLGWE